MTEKVLIFLIFTKVQIGFLWTCQYAFCSLLLRFWLFLAHVSMCFRAQMRYWPVWGGVAVNPMFGFLLSLICTVPVESTIVLCIILSDLLYVFTALLWWLDSSTFWVWFKLISAPKCWCSSIERWQITNVFWCQLEWVLFQSHPSHFCGLHGWNSGEKPHKVLGVVDALYQASY